MTLLKTPRDLPAVHLLLEDEALHLAAETFGQAALRDAVREVLGQTRQAMLATDFVGIAHNALLDAVQKNVEARFETSLKPVINATGVILHTNLGRAPLSEAAMQAVQSVVGTYNTLEFDLQTGGRGHRQAHIEEKVADVIGAKSAMVVNNAASAVLLALSALAKDREAIISRGQLIEIGGGFRIPDVMAQSGVHLVEVGTTNRTRIADYERAITEQSALLMRAHYSNFRVIGFTEEAALAEMAALAHAHDLLLVDDVGSGALLDTAQFGLQHEPTVGESLMAGADVVIFSGDKLLGGPQAGIIVGNEAALARLKRHPLARALRVDKMTIAALVATLDHYVRGDVLEKIPVWWMMARTEADLREVSEGWASAADGHIVAGDSTVGGGSLPGDTLPTVLFSPNVASVESAQAKLRANRPPVIARIKENRLLLDPRTVLSHQVQQVSQALQKLD